MGTGTTIHLSIYPSIYLSTYLPTYLPINLSINQSIYLSIYMYLLVLMVHSCLWAFCDVLALASVWQPPRLLALRLALLRPPVPARKPGAGVLGALPGKLLRGRVDCGDWPVWWRRRNE